MRQRRPRLTVAHYVLVAFYVLASVAMPFAHHDLACHLKSSTHCATCHVGTSTDPNSAGPALNTAVLQDAGRADQVSSFGIASPALFRSAGRSPPSTTL